MNDYEALLDKTTLLKGLGKEEIKNHLKKGRFKIVTYKKNTVIHLEKEYCNKLEIILVGRVVVEHLDESGGLLTIAEFYSDDLLGGNLLFLKNPRYPMTITSQKFSIILEIKKELLIELFSTHPSFLHLYLEDVSEHASILGYKIKQYVNKSIRENLLSYLNLESQKQGTKKIKLNMTKKALSEKMGVQRTSLSRELAKMKNDGLIAYDTKTITILN